MRNLLLLLCIVGLAACEKEKNPPNDELIIGKWVTTGLFRNGVDLGSKPRFEFTRGGKMYLTPQSGVFAASFNYVFVTSNHIDVQGVVRYDIRIDALTDKIFYFTVRSNQDNNVDVYQTVRQ